MRDACGRVIQIGDKIIYGSGGVLNTASAAVVTHMGRGKFKAQVISKTEYGARQGKEVTLGRAANGFPMINAIVYESQGKRVSFSRKATKVRSRKRPLVRK